MNNLIYGLLAANDNSATIDEVINASYNTFIGIVNIILPILMTVLLVLGMFYGIQIGVKYAKAEEDDEKKKAKGQLINVVVGVVIAIVFIAIIEIILNMDFVEKLFTPLSEKTSSVVNQPDVSSNA